MTPYILTYWVKTNTHAQWERVVERFYAETLDEAKSKVVIPNGIDYYNVTLAVDEEPQHQAPRKNKPNDLRHISDHVKLSLRLFTPKRLTDQELMETIKMVTKNH